VQLCERAVHTELQTLLQFHLLPWFEYVTCINTASTMVRKRSRRAQRDQPFADWSYDNIISLLSWLDFSLKHKEINFQATIVDHLKGAFALKQIEGKLKRLWSNHGPDQVPGTAKLKPDIKTRGSAAIPKYLTEATTENIRLAIEALEKGYVASFSTPPNRRLRSISRLDATPPIQESRLTTPTVPKAGTPQHQKRKFDSVSTTTFGVTPEIGHVHSSFSNTSKSRKKQKTYSKRDVRLPYCLLFVLLLMCNSEIVVFVLRRVVRPLLFQSNFLARGQEIDDHRHLSKTARTILLISWTENQMAATTFARYPSQLPL
jgi:hypothetical protein